MDNLSKLALALLATTFTFSANADPIEVVALPGGEHPATLGGYVMTPFDEPTGTSDCTPSDIGRRGLLRGLSRQQRRI